MAENIIGKATFNSVNMALTPEDSCLDVNILSWNVGGGGNYYKKWSETGGLSGVNTTYVIGDIIESSTGLCVRVTARIHLQRRTSPETRAGKVAPMQF